MLIYKQIQEKSSVQEEYLDISVSSVIQETIQIHYGQIGKNSKYNTEIRKATCNICESSALQKQNMACFHQTQKRYRAISKEGLFDLLFHVDIEIYIQNSILLKTVNKYTYHCIFIVKVRCLRIYCSIDLHMNNQFNISRPIQFIINFNGSIHSQSDKARAPKIKKSSYNIEDVYYLYPKDHKIHLSRKFIQY